MLFLEKSRDFLIPRCNILQFILIWKYLIHSLKPFSKVDTSGRELPFCICFCFFMKTFRRNVFLDLIFRNGQIILSTDSFSEPNVAETYDHGKNVVQTYHWFHFMCLLLFFLFPLFLVCALLIKPALNPWWQVRIKCQWQNRPISMSCLWTAPGAWLTLLTCLEHRLCSSSSYTQPHPLLSLLSFSEICPFVFTHHLPLSLIWVFEVALHLSAWFHDFAPPAHTPLSYRREL